jgi:hypothetical protein
MLRGAGLLDGRTNSMEGILGSTREFSGYNYSLPSYTDLGLPVSKEPPGVSIRASIVTSQTKDRIIIIAAPQGGTA